MWAKEMSEERMRNTGKNLVDFLINTSGVLTSSYYREKLPNMPRKRKGGILILSAVSRRVSNF